MAGTLTYADFEKYVHELARVSREVGDGWRVEGGEGEEGGLYLSKEVTRPLTLGPTDHCSQGEELELSVEEANDPSTLSAPPATTVHFQYHVLYSASYSVPLLFVQAVRENGRQLSLEEIWSAMPSCLVDKGGPQWSTLTQAEHPILGRPFFHLHPCHTASLMAGVTHGQSYLLTWLSTCGPLVGLEVPLVYASPHHQSHQYSCTRDGN